MNDLRLAGLAIRGILTVRSMQEHKQRCRVLLQGPDESVPLGVLQRRAEAGEAEGGAHEGEGSRRAHEDICDELDDGF